MVETIAVVAALKTVAHALMMVSAAIVARSEVASVIPAASAVVMPAVSAVIDVVEMRASEVEVVAVGVSGVDAEVPVAGVPVEGAVEIGGGTEGPVLPVEQDIAHVHVAVVPVGSVEVGLCVDAQQVVEVDLVGCLVLVFGQVELVSHFVGQEQRLLTGLLIAHCVSRYCYCEQCCQCY